MRYVALVRNVMIGREGLSREVLLDIFRDAGALRPESHLATGNVTFHCIDELSQVVRSTAEDSIAAVIGRHEPVILRPHDFIGELAMQDPFELTDREKFACEVTFLDDRAQGMAPGSVAKVAGLQLAELRRHELLTARSRGARAKHPLPIVEKVAQAPATTRAWSTVLRIAEV